jgi:ketosteroid isomerase-like protein
VLQRYIRGCNTGDTTLLRSTLAADVTVYFLNRAPVTGRDAVVTMWKGYHATARARWSIDDAVVDGNEAVMEWSALRDRPLGPHGFDRGVDWYVFRDGLIVEIRQYYDSRGTVPMDQVYEQRGFPYAQRGYPTAANLDSRLP